MFQNMIDDAIKNIINDKEKMASIINDVLEGKNNEEEDEKDPYPLHLVILMVVMAILFFFGMYLIENCTY